MSQHVNGNAYKITMYNHKTNQRRFFVVVAKSVTEAIEAVSTQFIGQCTTLTLIDGTVLLADNIQVKGFLQ